LTRPVHPSKKDELVAYGDFRLLSLHIGVISSISL
jgi:hypothetical protein